MSLAETPAAEPRKRSKPKGGDGATAPFAESRTWESVMRSPPMAVRKVTRLAPSLTEERVRARPAVTPQLSMMIGMTAIGLGLWGALFPRSVKRTLGVESPPMVVRALFGARELYTGFTLAGDPTRVDALWMRVAGDFADLAILKSLTGRRNPSRGGAKFALGAVLAITALDIVTAVRMSNVQRTCPAKGAAR